MTDDGDDSGVSLLVGATVVDGRSARLLLLLPFARVFVDDDDDTNLHSSCVGEGSSPLDPLACFLPLLLLVLVLLLLLVLV